LGGGNGPCVQRWYGIGADGEYDSVCPASSALSVDVYTPLVATYDGSTLSLYIGGTLAGSAQSSTPLATTNSPMMIGVDYYFPTNFVGKIDEVALYDHALTPARVLAHAQIGMGQ
jgi:Concanavalin A-like lectin/glucanases superfamily